VITGSKTYSFLALLETASLATLEMFTEGFVIAVMAFLTSLVVEMLLEAFRGFVMMMFKSLHSEIY